MVDIIKAIILGLVQGVAEFLPISSSGHLKFLHSFLEINIEGEVAFDIAIHFATLIAIIIVYFERYIILAKGAIEDGAMIRNSNQRMTAIYNESNHLKTILFVIVATIPTAIVGLSVKKHLEEIPLIATGIAFLITGIIIALPHFSKRESKKEPKDLTILFAFLVGLAQSFAIMPGISRSGTTISIAIMLGASRQFSGYFSFLLMLPAVVGAMILSLDDLSSINTVFLVSGFIAALISGYFSLKLLMKLLDKGKFWYFSPYCWALGIFVIIRELLSK